MTACGTWTSSVSDASSQAGALVLPEARVVWPLRCRVS